MYRDGPVPESLDKPVRRGDAAVRLHVGVTSAALLGALASYALGLSAINTLCSGVFFLGLGAPITTLAIDGVLALRRRWGRREDLGRSNDKAGV